MLYSQESWKQVQIIELSSESREEIPTFWENSAVAPPRTGFGRPQIFLHFIYRNAVRPQTRNDHRKLGISFVGTVIVAN